MVVVVFIVEFVAAAIDVVVAFVTSAYVVVATSVAVVGGTAAADVIVVFSCKIVIPLLLISYSYFSALTRTIISHQSIFSV